MSRVNALARQVQRRDVPGAPSAVADEAVEGRESDEIGQRADAINDFIRQRDAARQGELARERAEASGAAKSELPSRIGHELRTPLCAIVGSRRRCRGARASPSIRCGPRGSN